MTASSTTMKYKEELYNLDPLHRMDNVPLFKDDGLVSNAKKIYKELKDDIFLIRLRDIVWREFSKQNGIESDDDMQNQILSCIDELGVKEIIKGLVTKLFERSNALSGGGGSQIYHLPIRRSNARYSADECVLSIRQARIHWEQGINDELQAIAIESRRPFLLIRNPGELNPLLENSNVLQGDDDIMISRTSHRSMYLSCRSNTTSDNVKFLFDSEDLLETGVTMEGSNSNPSVYADRYLGLLKLNLGVPKLEQIIERFRDLACTEPQFALDEGHMSGGNRFCVQRHEEGEFIIANGTILDARHYLKRGAPPSLRGRLWRRAIGLSDEVSKMEETTALLLRFECDRLDLLTDELFLYDVLTVLDDPRYFIFEEELKELVFSFSRDEWVRHNCHYQIHAPLIGKLEPEFTFNTAMPPSSIQPYLGFATYFAPLCYIYKNRSSCYTVARALFCQIWCKLNVLCSDDGTILQLCKSFEYLLMHLHPRLFIHFVSLGIQPLKIAFPWIQLGFVGLLDVEQVLCLWDRIVGYMDLMLLPVAAVAIFLDRAEPLLRCSSEAEVTSVLLEGSRLRIIALIQMLLLKDYRPL